MSRNFPKDPEQRVPFAYCAEAKRVLDIFEAQAAYFDKPEPRSKLTFRCPYEDCTGKIIGVNYWKPITERKKRPHFRAEDHPNSCVYSIEDGPAEPTERQRRRTQERRKSTGIVDVFLADQPFEHRLRQGQPRTGFWKRRSADRLLEDDSDDQKAGEGRNKSRMLSEVVSSYWELSHEERLRTKLELRRGAVINRTTYKNAFRRIEEYEASKLAVVWAGAKVKKVGESFNIWFYDEVDARDGGPPRQPLLDIPLDHLRQYRFGSLLENQLATACGNRQMYLQVYFLGSLRRTDRGGLQVTIDNFDHLAFIEKRKLDRCIDTPPRRMEDVRSSDDLKKTVPESGIVVMARPQQDANSVVRTPTRNPSSTTGAGLGATPTLGSSKGVVRKSTGSQPSRPHESSSLKGDQQQPPLPPVERVSAIRSRKPPIELPQHRSEPSGALGENSNNTLMRVWKFVKSWYRNR